MVDDQTTRPADAEACDMSEQTALRVEKLNRLKAAGRDPFLITRFERSHRSGEVLSGFDALENREVTFAGRMMSRRIMGKASFAHLLDRDGQLQIYARRDDLGEAGYEAFLDYDLGDVLGVRGTVFKTRTGEISLHAKEIVLLTKSLHPLPEKFHGLKDTDTRFRQRYLDLIVNPEVRRIFEARSRMLAAVRAFLDARGFLEVDTPVLNTLETGAAARPFITHHNALDIDLYLRIETELHLKRLIVGGFEQVYEVGRIFRNEGMDTRHNPEFTTVELYQAYTDYVGIMELVESLYESVALKVCGKTRVPFMGHEIELKAPWARMTMNEAVVKYTGVDIMACADDAAARAAAVALGFAPAKDATKGDCLVLLFEETCEKNLIQPTFIYDYPVEISPLAKRKPGDPLLTERFEYFITGMEFGNAFSELNDPIDQKGRFEYQAALKRAQGLNAQVDDDYVTALEYGLPPTGGLGFGIDRMAMLFTDSDSIREVLLFPTMKPREGA